MKGMYGANNQSPLIYLSGTLCTASTFAYQQAHLADIIESQSLAYQGQTIADMATWVLQHAPKTFALLGFSQGAIVALEIMRQAPERVSKLCLIACNSRAPIQVQLDTWKTWKHEVKAGKQLEIAQTFANNVHPDRRSDPGLKQQILDMAMDTPSEVFIDQLKALASRMDSRPYLHQISCPTLLVVGRQDPITPLAFHQEIQEYLPQARLIPIEDCGHYVPLEQPQALTALLRYWLS